MKTLFFCGAVVAVGLILLGMQTTGALLFVLCVAMFVLWVLLAGAELPEKADYDRAERSDWGLGS